MNIVISGGSKGIGKGIAERFAEANHNIYINARSEKTLISTAKEIMNAHPSSQVYHFAADLGKRDEAVAFARWVNEQCIPDVIVNNAGGFLPGNVFDEPEGTLEAMLSDNLMSAYYLTRLLLPQMIERKSGHIFNMCSVASLKAYDNGGSYSISKYALAGFSHNLREELKPYNIKVTAVYPGAVYTDSWKASGLPPSRFIETDDIANLVYTVAQLSPQACVEEIVIRPMQGDI